MLHSPVWCVTSKFLIHKLLDRSWDYNIDFDFKCVGECGMIALAIQDLEANHVSWWGGNS